MGANWINKIYKFEPTRICTHIEKSKIIDAKGNVKFKGFGHKEYEVILHSMLEFPSGIPEYETRRIITNALFKAGKKGTITPDRVLAEINKHLAERKKEPDQRYALASSLSLDKSLDLKRLHFDNKIIIFEKKLHKSFHKESQKLIPEASNSLFANLPENYLQIRVHVTAKSIHDASITALNAIDYVRGIWNWVINRRQYFRFSWGGKPKPINKIILGPIHTIHTPKGELASDSTWWYEPSYIGAIKPYKLKTDETTVLYDSFNFAQDSFSKHKYPDIIRDAIIRYTRALDERVWSTAFIKLWGVLELLTDTIGQSYETTVKRTAYMYEDREYNYQVLQHLRKYRNSSIHHDSENSEVETYLYQLKNNVDILLDFHITNRFGFDSIQDASSFLSLPMEKASIEKRIKNLDKALKFRGYK